MRFEALYLHIPFCKSKCAYCDFDSRAIPGCALEEAVGTYCESLLAQGGWYMGKAWRAGGR